MTIPLNSPPFRWPCSSVIVCMCAHYLCSTGLNKFGSALSHKQNVPPGIKLLTGEWYIRLVLSNHRWQILRPLFLLYNHFIIVWYASNLLYYWQFISGWWFMLFFGLHSEHTRNSVADIFYFLIKFKSYPPKKIT